MKLSLLSVKLDSRRTFTCLVSTGFHRINTYSRKHEKHDSFRPAFVLCIFCARLVTMNAKADGLDMARASRYGFQVCKKVLLEEVVVSLSLNVGLNVGILRDRCNFDVFLQALCDDEESSCCFTMFDDVATTQNIRKPIHWALSNP